MSAPRRRLRLLAGAATLALAGGLLVGSPSMATTLYVYPTTQSPVVISKTWSPGPVANGGSATATLTATNPTGTPAHVIIQDTYDHGLVPGTLPGGCGHTSYTGYPLFWCHLNVPAFGSASVAVPFTASYAGKHVYTKDLRSHERIAVLKTEVHWNNFTGQQTTHSIECPAGYVMLDHSLRKQNVDQGAGTLEDVHVVTSDLTPTAWTVDIRNATLGQAQGKLWATCLRGHTNLGGTFAVSGVNSSSVDNFLPVGDTESQFIARCATGEIPIAVNLKAAPANANYAPWQSLLFTQTGLYANGGPSTVLFATIHQPADVTLQWRCLSTTVSPSGHRLRLGLVSDTTSVPAGVEVDHDVTCDDDAKGLIGGWRGGKVNGAEPRPKIRTYWWRNTGAAPAAYTSHLVCAGNRLVHGGKLKASATDPRCNYLGGVHVVSSSDERWLNDDEECLLVTQGP